MKKLETILSQIDGKSYKYYRDIEGVYFFDPIILVVERVQSDPFASPSNIIAKIKYANSGFGEEFNNSKIKKIALSDYIMRNLQNKIENYSGKVKGSGSSGVLGCVKTNQCIYQRSACIVTDTEIELRFSVGLPGFGRKVAGIQARILIFDQVQSLLREVLYAENYKIRDIENHINTFIEYHDIKQYLLKNDYISFIANGSILPRKSGFNDLPSTNDIIPFKAPKENEIEIKTTFGVKKGFGIKKGFTLITGGGYHGKSTLLSAIESGVYAHIKGDGREYVVTRDDCVKVRVEDGRFVHGLNISNFLDNLPNNTSTTNFSTDNASGSTSQASNIIETLELNSKFMILDEDTTATNLMVKDDLMQKIIHKEDEPINTFINSIDSLKNEKNISIILVVGAISSYIPFADTIIKMKNYLPINITKEAKDIIKKSNNSFTSNNSIGSIDNLDRIPVPNSLKPVSGKKIKIRSRGTNLLQYGRTDVHTEKIEQLIDPLQLNFIGDAIYYISKNVDGKITLNEAIDRFYKEIESKGFSILSPYPKQDYAIARKYELGFVINRLKTLRIKK